MLQSADESYCLKILYRKPTWTTTAVFQYVKTKALPNDCSFLRISISWSLALLKMPNTQVQRVISALKKSVGNCYKEKLSLRKNNQVFLYFLQVVVSYCLGWLVPLHPPTFLKNFKHTEKLEGIKRSTVTIHISSV